MLFNKNLAILICCQILGTSGSVLMITITGLIGIELAPTTSLSTLPVSLIVLGTALATLPASQIMKRYGRRKGFSGASLLACIACLFCVFALNRSSFLLFCISTMCFGFNLAFILQYRFAATESVPEDLASRAISWVLFGSIGGAFLAPEILNRSESLLEIRYTGSLIIQATLYALSSMLLLLLSKSTTNDTTTAIKHKAGSIKGLVRQKYFLIAILAGVTAQAVMTLLMTATPISMHHHQGHSMLATSNVIRAHVIAMYLPSLISGYLIYKFGLKLIMISGCALLFLTVMVGFSGQQIPHYWITLVLLGVGWNFLFVGGTTLLTTTYTNKNRYTAQGMNDFVVFGCSAAASLLAGTLLTAYGWQWLVLAPLPLLIFTSIFLILLPKTNPSTSSS